MEGETARLQALCFLGLTAYWIVRGEYMLILHVIVLQVFSASALKPTQSIGCSVSLFVVPLGRDPEPHELETSGPKAFLLKF